MLEMLDAQTHLNECSLTLAGLLEPLPIGAPNFRERLDSLLAAMGADILGRVMGDKLEEDRSVWW